jgi:hypothetical protein
MYHGLNNSILYSAYSITCTFFRERDGGKKSIGGTAFFISQPNKLPTLVTNRHVLDIGYGKGGGEFAGFKLQETTIEGFNGVPNAGLPTERKRLLVDPTQDVRFASNYDEDVGIIPAPRVQLLEGVGGGADFSIPRKLLADDSDIFDKLTICDFVAFPGFPPWHDKLARRPILRVGTISSDPRADYSSTQRSMGRRVAYEAFSFGGSSGSPVFALQKGIKPGEGMEFSGYRPFMMVGINAGHIKTDGGEPDHVVEHFDPADDVCGLVQDNEFALLRVLRGIGSFGHRVSPCFACVPRMRRVDAACTAVRGRRITLR